jgi:hypothetical protein
VVGDDGKEENGCGVEGVRSEKRLTTMTSPKSFSRLDSIRLNQSAGGWMIQFLMIDLSFFFPISYLPGVDDGADAEAHAAPHQHAHEGLVEGRLGMMVGWGAREG